MAENAPPKQPTSVRGDNDHPVKNTNSSAALGDSEVLHGESIEEVVRDVIDINAGESVA